MSASFALTLDTRPPAVTFLHGAYAAGTEMLSIPYSIDEPSLASATAITDTGREIAGTILPDRVVFPLDGIPWRSGTIILHAYDEVWNSVTKQRVFSATGSDSPVRFGRSVWSPVMYRDNRLTESVPVDQRAIEELALIKLGRVPSKR